MEMTEPELENLYGLQLWHLVFLFSPLQPVRLLLEALGELSFQSLSQVAVNGSQVSEKL